MHDILEEITAHGLNRDGARAARRSKQEGQKSQPDAQKAAPYVFRYEAEGGEFMLEVRFKSSDVGQQQVEEALKRGLNSLESSRGDS
jgi:hypothetical protein